MNGRLTGRAASLTCPGMNVTAGDPRPLLAILAGDSVLCTDLGWQNAAACAGIGQEMFYQDKGLTPAAVKEVCRTRCPVRRECLTDALEHFGDYASGRHGCWGGTSPEQREALLERFRGDVAAAVNHELRNDAEDTTTTPRKAAA